MSGRRGERGAAAPAPADTAVLTPAQLASWLQISQRQLERIDWLPVVELGGSRSKRYLVRAVARALEERARQGQDLGIRRGA